MGSTLPLLLLEGKEKVEEVVEMVEMVEVEDVVDDDVIGEDKGGIIEETTDGGERRFFVDMMKSLG